MFLVGASAMLVLSLLLSGCIPWFVNLGGSSSGGYGYDPWDNSDDDAWRYDPSGDDSGSSSSGGSTSSGDDSSSGDSSGGDSSDGGSSGGDSSGGDDDPFGDDDDGGSTAGLR